MADFRKIVSAPPNSKFILDGNSAFALGCVHAGYHAATGYPGTPSTEVIDKSLAFVQDKMKVGWSVNEAVAVSVAFGHSMAGHDSVVTMKIPGVFQAGDAITTSAFFSAQAGAFVIYAATDYAPSNTQHVIDVRYFCASTRLPVLEPRNHQEMYEIAWIAADLSKKFNTPVMVLVSGTLAHAEALIITKEPRLTEPLRLKENLKDWMLMPGIARNNYNKATQIRIPGIKMWSETSDLVRIHYGSDDWGIIVNGVSEITVKEALKITGYNPSMLSLAIAYPLPEQKIKEFAGKIKSKLFIIEDGDKFLEEKIRLLNIDLIGKDEYSTVTNWKPENVLAFLTSNGVIQTEIITKKEFGITPIIRPPTICPGCQYRAFALTVNKLKKRKLIYASFGDIGCSSLLYFLNAIDTVSCMGASDAIRQGFVISRPELAHKVISVIGDSTECHSGLDATRNAVFRNVPGVKIILDNYITAMTGGQVAPSSNVNLEGRPHRFSLKKAIEAEGGRTVVVDSYNLKQVEEELLRSLDLAENGTYSTLIFEAPCIHETANKDKIRTIEIDYDKCGNCGLCDMCPGIEFDENKTPHFTALCTNCGSNKPVCMQCCNKEAIRYISGKDATEKIPVIPQIPDIINVQHPEMDKLPKSLRVAIRGIGGQGNLFFGRILAEVALQTPYAETNIVKGDTHGMAQLGGPVLSTFSCGDVYSSDLAPNSADALIVMEVSEILRPGFFDLLKKGGNIIINNFTSLPVNTKKENYPKLVDIEKALEGYNIIHVNANKLANELGDVFGKSSNLVVLGVLSTVKPFNLIPEEIWLSAILSVSPNEISKSYNILAFKKGRSEFNEKS